MSVARLALALVLSGSGSALAQHAGEPQPPRAAPREIVTVDVAAEWQRAGGTLDANGRPLIVVNTFHPTLREGEIYNVGGTYWKFSAGGWSRPTEAELAAPGPKASPPSVASDDAVDKLLAKDLERQIAQLEAARKQYEKDPATVQSIDKSLEALRAKRKDRKAEASIIGDLKADVRTITTGDPTSRAFRDAVLSAHSALTALDLSDAYADSTIVLSTLVPKEKMDGVKAAFVTHPFRGIDAFASVQGKSPADQIAMKARLMELLVRRGSGMGPGKGPTFEGITKEDEGFPAPFFEKVFDRRMASVLSTGIAPNFQVGDRKTHLRDSMMGVFNGSADAAP